MSTLAWPQCMFRFTALLEHLAGVRQPRQVNSSQGNLRQSRLAASGHKLPFIRFDCHGLENRGQTGHGLNVAVALLAFCLL